MKMYLWMGVGHLLPDEAEGVYMIFSANDEIIYIGMAENLKNRLSPGRLKKDFSSYRLAYCYVYYTFDSKQRFELEKHLIRMFQPKLNKYKYKTWLNYPHKKFS